MITYKPLWRTMNKRKTSAYKLIRYHGYSSNTIYRLRHNKGISTRLIDRLCEILDCKVEEVLEHIPESKQEGD